MIAATYSDGKIQPTGPIPEEWNDGRHLLIDEDDQAAVEAEFDRLFAGWQADTRFLSAVDRIIMHPAYHRMIGPWKKRRFRSFSASCRRNRAGGSGP